MNILIHACSDRMPYVDSFLIPYLTANGWEKSDISVWEDSKKRGCLRSYIDSYEALPANGDTWHLQDDVLPAKDFYKRAKDLENVPGIMCGFGNVHFEQYGRKFGQASNLADMFYSFPCIRIPNAMIKEWLKWFDEHKNTQELAGFVEGNKYVDYFFMLFIGDNPRHTLILNLKPCLVEHVDEYVGGSKVNKGREKPAKALEFVDDGGLEQLKAWAVSKHFIEEQ